MGTRAKAVLNGTDRPFYLADVTVGRDDVECDGQQGQSNALEFVVGMNVADRQTARLIATDDVAKSS